jgi:peptide/nickel transport system permease protein/dipeptide transport system permease protein
MKNKKPYKNPEDRHPFFDQLSQLWRNKTAVLGLVIITIFILSAILAPYLTPHDPIETSLYDQLKPPVWHETGTWKNILGTDDLGRDILSRLIYGARVSLLVAVISVGLAFLCGTLLGCISGYYKGFRDSIIMRFMDIILAFPYILLAIVVVACAAVCWKNVKRTMSVPPGPSAPGIFALFLLPFYPTASAL